MPLSTSSQEVLGTGYITDASMLQLNHLILLPLVLQLTSPFMKVIAELSKWSYVLVARIDEKGV